jgi:hypothetical protein
MRLRDQRYPLTHVDTAVRITAMYDELWDRPPPAASKQQRGAQTVAKRLALRNGWPAPLAWDDIDNDPAPAATESFIGPVCLDWLCGHDTCTLIRPVDEVKVQRAVAGHRVDLNRDEREAAQTILEARGLSAREIAERVGRTPRTIVRRRSDRAA